MHLVGYRYLNVTSHYRCVGGPHGDASVIAYFQAQPDGYVGTFIYTPAQSDGYGNAAGDLATGADSHLATLAIRIA